MAYDQTKRMETINAKEILAKKGSYMGHTNGRARGTGRQRCGSQIPERVQAQESNGSGLGGETVNTELMFSSKSDDWETPQDLFNLLNNKFHFSFDVCATAENAKCEKFFNPDMNGLKMPWVEVAKSFRLPPVFWMNPPYSKPEQPCKPNCRKKTCIKRGYHFLQYKPGQEDWIKKAYEESQKGALVVALLPARTDTQAFHKYIYNKNNIEFLEGRLKFGGCEHGAPFPSMIVVFRQPEGVRA